MPWVCMIFVVLLGFSAVGECGNSLYGQPVEFSLTKEIKFPDFTVRFLGTRREISKVYTRGFLYYDFEISSNKGSKVTASWSAGTGELGPIEFSLDDKKYFLELRANSLETDPKKMWLQQNEMIIWKKEVYLEKQMELNKR